MKAGLGRPYSADSRASETACRELTTLRDGRLGMSTAQRNEPAPTVAAECEPTLRWPPKDGQPSPSLACAAWTMHWRFGPAPLGADVSNVAWHPWRAATVRQPPAAGRPATTLAGHWFNVLMRWQLLRYWTISLYSAQRLSSAAAEGSPLERRVRRSTCTA